MASYIANRKQNCPLCGRKAKAYVDFSVELRPLTSIPVISRCSLLYCVYCALPFANEEIRAKIRKENDGFGIMTFKEDSENVNRTRFMIYNLDCPQCKENDYIKVQSMKFKERRNAISQIPSAIVTICAETDMGIKDFIIVEDKNEENKEKGILLYTDDLARELLSAAYLENRHLKGMYEGKTIFIRQLIRSKRTVAGLPEDICPSTITICSGGGYYSSIKSPRYKIAEILLYSSFYDRYELAKSTIVDSKEVYMDVGIFRKYINQYGSPQNDLRFIHSVSNSDDESEFYNLRKESIYKEYGYSVSCIDGQSTEYRHELLAEMVDLRLTTTSEIKKYLTFLEKTHKSDKYIYAKKCWKDDREFIMSYIPDTKRFFTLKKDV